ncbi:transcriptional regulator, LuxR family [Aminobacter sp. Y103A]|jgi:DNA-binding CsgD family transcriptional regulator|uniref:helix-turn-helix transcriptional regulator n=1 Tax=Aminobacter sp. Y103A TaxID=1870862 RepID=UPI0025728E3D|nr:helix-turn-helix transcriptional regulator [Aminobacter sp. SS-2016]BBD40451.1 transcriptional regulator, LuxR family [Aminobacter sp. SS-2016]
MPQDDYRDVAELVGAIGAPRFPSVLAAWIRSHVAFDMIAIVVYRGSRPPLHIHDDFKGERARNGLKQYLAQTYILNPFYQSHLKGIASGVYRVRDLAPDHYLQSEVYRSYEIIIAETEEIGYVTRDWPRGLEEIDIAVTLDDGETTEIGIYSARPGSFDDAAVERLNGLLPLIETSFRQHWQRIKARHAAKRHSIGAGWAEAAYESFGAELLTNREREVVVLVLRGHSSDSIAAHLDISRATVKTHRKHAYERLAISTQAELLSLFLRHVRDRMPAG